MTDFTIPDEAVEAARDELRSTGLWATDSEARAAILAAINAWPGMQRRPSGAYYAIVTAAHLVLPLPDEGAPRQGDACKAGIDEMTTDRRYNVAERLFGNE